MIKKLKKEQLLIGALIGILLLVIAIPVPKTEKDVTIETDSAVLESALEQTTEEQLKSILQKISGVGRVEVLITYEDHGRVVVEKDKSLSEELVQEADANGGTRTTTTSRNDVKTVYDSKESPYVVQEFSPVVKGILVVAEGGGNMSVKKQIQETIQALFGLDAHKISIMKMEVLK